MAFLYRMYQHPGDAITLGTCHYTYVQSLSTNSGEALRESSSQVTSLCRDGPITHNEGKAHSSVPPTGKTRSRGAWEVSGLSIASVSLQLF